MIKTKIKNYLLKKLLSKPERNKISVYNGFSIREYPDYLVSTASKQPDIREEELFSDIAEDAVKSGKTCLYYDRLYTIYRCLIDQARRVEKKSLRIAEIGVYRGGGSRFMALLLNRFGIQNKRLDCFDTFCGHNSRDIIKGRDRLDKHDETTFSDTSLASVQKLLADFDFVHCHEGRFEDTCNILDGAELDIVHLDVDLYAPIQHGLTFLASKLKVGGVFIVDDYRFLTCPGAKEAVDEFLSQSKDKFFGLPLLTGQFIITKIHN